jgi:hypothetical protein
MKTMKHLLISSLALCVTSVFFASARAEDAAKPQITFKKTQLDNVFRSEGAAVGDFNHDGKMDISAGSVYYAAPDWKMVPILEKLPDYKDGSGGYSNSFCNFADDINGDGWTDLLVVDFPGKETWWFENPQTAGGPWKRHVCTPVTNNESPTYVDIDGNGKRALLMGYSPDPKNPDGPERRMGIIRRTQNPLEVWKIQPISAVGAPGTTKFSHGLGMGDVNKDGRNDVLVKDGWWESPADATQAEWTFHKVNFGENCAQMFVYDYDGDGDQDVLFSAAHHLGIWWAEQKPGEVWEKHEISKDFSQTHALVQVDINGDGLPDFVTGKRFWAHGPKGDVNPGDPAVMYWFELTRKDGKPIWIPHPFDDNSGVGTQFEVADVNGDGLLDVVVANKKGANYFQQVRSK